MTIILGRQHTRAPSHRLWIKLISPSPPLSHPLSHPYIPHSPKRAIPRLKRTHSFYKWQSYSESERRAPSPRLWTKPTSSSPHTHSPKRVIPRLKRNHSSFPQELLKTPSVLLLQMEIIDYVQNQNHK